LWYDDVERVLPSKDRLSDGGHAARKFEKQPATAGCSATILINAWMKII